MADISDQCLSAFCAGDKEDAADLLENVEQPQSIKDDVDATLVHWAAAQGWPDICQTLIDKHHCDPTEKDKQGFSPLHMACYDGRAEVVGYLLGLPTVWPTVNDENVGGMSALDLACGYNHLSVVQMLVKVPSISMPTKERLPSHRFSILSVLSSRMVWTSEFFIPSLFRVFMAGNTGAGKTTLTAAMKTLTQSSPSGRGGMVSGVKTLTAGICPTHCSG